MNESGIKSTLQEMFLDQLDRNPSERAVASDSGCLTIEQLAACANDVASQLRDCGVKSGSLVSLYVNPSIEMEIGVFGILFAGCGYIPVSPEYPSERVAYMLEDSHTPVVLCDEATHDSLREQQVTRGVNLITIRRDLIENPPSLDSAPSLKMDADLPAYVIYTSGTTGKPKGVVIKHRSIAAQMQWISRAYRIGQDTVILQKTPASFDAAQWEILSPTCGATVVAGTPGVHKDRRELIRLLSTHEVTTLQCVPTLLSALVDDERFGECDSLRQIFCGGAAFNRSLATRCQQRMPRCEIVNLYGPTECTINASAHTVDIDASDYGEPTIPIGRPVDGTEFHVLDECLTPVGEGEKGELYISGIQVGDGYLNRPKLTQERFLKDVVTDCGRAYRTGDLVRQNPDGTYQFVGRVDNQVKHRGYRIELEEIQALAAEHEWVKGAAAILKSDSSASGEDRTQLVLFVELNSETAPLMDGGTGETHHASKASRTQFKFQLTTPGRRDPEQRQGRPVVELDGRNPTPEQRRLAFARKTYRNYEGGKVSRDDILELLAGHEADPAGEFVGFSCESLGVILRNLGQFKSHNRTLPKHSYASPGALYATQVYLELSGLEFVSDGYYYYDPVEHQLVLINNRQGDCTEPSIKLHFVGKRRAIEPIYKNNIREVLEIETGHIIGLLERILPKYGMAVSSLPLNPTVIDHLDVYPDDYYLGTFVIGPHDKMEMMIDTTDVYVQSHRERISELPEGLYSYVDGSLNRVCEEIIRKQDVIALNQNVYSTSSFGISVISKSEHAQLGYVELGRKLQKLMMNDVGLGFMSSGYSSKTGNDLPSAMRFSQILGSHSVPVRPFYFFVGGRVSEKQRDSDDMHEDAPLTKGPAEMLRDSLREFLPEYSVPDRVEVVDSMPKTPVGKIDTDDLESRIEFKLKPFIPPRTEFEQRIGTIWKRVLGNNCFRESVRDHFVEDMGGDSLLAVDLLQEIEAEFGFAKGDLENKLTAEIHTIEQWALLVAERIGRDAGQRAVESRRLATLAIPRQIYLWPGLGGTTNRLGHLANQWGNRTVIGLESYGVNPGQVPYESLQEMAVADVELIQKTQPAGPYSLWGYSFGARVAFETAFQLETMGERVDELVLIAPGSPIVTGCEDVQTPLEADYTSKEFVSMLYSVFAAGLDEPGWSECLSQTVDRQSFTKFILEKFPKDPDFVDRIVTLVSITYGLNFTMDELLARPIKAPITVFRTVGDQASFIDQSADCRATQPYFVNLPVRHYEVLHPPALEDLMNSVRELGLGGLQ